MTDHSLPTSQTSPSAWRSIGLWMAALMAVSQAANAIRVLADPNGFSDYMGLPIPDGESVGFVYVYALRAAFIAIAVGIFVVLRNISALMWLGAAALIMPAGDTLLTWQAGAPDAIIIRHAATTLYVAVVVALLLSWQRKYS